MPSEDFVERRKSLKADHILMRDRISTMRDEVASELQHDPANGCEFE